MDFISGYKSYTLNIKQFYSVFTYENIFYNLKLSGTSTQVPLNRLRQGFKQLDMELSDYTLSKSHDGNDDTINKPVYSFKQAFYL